MMSSSSDSRDDGKIASYPRIVREDLDVLEQLGCGSFGSVYRGIWRNQGKQQVVAMKKVFILEKEVDILSQIRHRNIIQFFGVSPANPDYYIVTEFAEHGSLYEYLHNDSAELPFDRILQWALQIAHGVSYLHNEAPVTIIHRDLKSKNIVLSSGLICKLCDFGTSKDLTHSFTMPTWAGTAAWMSPEIISQREGITTATDVYSYAVVLWELVSREVPYKGLTEFKIYSIITQHGERLVIPDTCPKQLADLLKDCWHTNPKERLKMRNVIVLLKQMESNEQLNKECTHFVQQKEEWRHEIERQVSALNDLKIDLARQKEELERREQALNRRETSHRSLMHLHETVTLDDINNWTDADVCAWLQVICDTYPEPLDEAVVERLTTCVKKYEIDGPRLLSVQAKDLEKLGTEQGFFCDYLMQYITELQSKHQYDFVDFPTLKMSSVIEHRNKIDRSKQPFDFPIVVHVGLYQREVSSTTCSTKYRFKIFVDSDWKYCTMGDSMPPEIYDSAAVIKNVCISLVDAHNRVLLDSVRCLCPPFGYLEWVDAPQSGVVHLTCSIAFTDQIIKPRNTCIKADISEFNRPQTIQTRVIMLKIRPIATNTSLSRINSALLHKGIDRPPSSNNLQATWRSRRSSFSTESPVSIERPITIPRMQMWSNVARRDLHHSVSMNYESTDDFPSLPTRSSHGPTLSSPMSSPQTLPKPTHNPFLHVRRTRKSSEHSAEEETRHPSFFLDSSSPPVIQEDDGLLLPESSKEDGSEDEEEKCCKNNCRHRHHIQPPKEISNMDEMEPIKKNRRRRKGPSKSHGKKPSVPEGAAVKATEQESDADADAEKEENAFSKSSQKIYGGYNKWRWRQQRALEKKTMA